jgi:ribosomal protein S27AE
VIGSFRFVRFLPTTSERSVFEQGGTMAILNSFCPRCERAVYLSAEENKVCPVCSGPVAASPASPSKPAALK